jgi:Pro-kumamolisin, activation domain/Bacterial Ig-like domain (group 3)
LFIGTTNTLIWRTMRRLISSLFSHAAVACVLWFMGSYTAFSQAGNSVPTPLIVQSIDENNLVELTGNLHPGAKTGLDQGVADDTLALQRMMLVFKRSDAQEATLKKFLDGQKNSKSADYHKWLTPASFGARFGAAGQDVSTISGWLMSHGFSIESVANAKNVLIFSGTNAQLRAAFHTEIHKYKSGASVRYANSVNPKIPAALAPAIAGIARLNNFPLQSLHSNLAVVKKQKDSPQWRPVNSTIKPQFNTSISGTDFFAVGPSDFATIYDVQPLWDAGIDGTGQTIAIAGRSDINPSDVDAFRSYFGLPTKKLNVIYNGANPGMVYDDESEADLDVEWSGAVAKNATIDLVVSGSTDTTDGIQLASQYIVDNNLAPVMSVSFGNCEAALGTAGNQLFNEIWQQAAAQGITVMVSTGDAGSAACDQGSNSAQFGMTVNGLSSTPYNIAVGGTDLYGTYLRNSEYWNTSNDSTTKQSVKSYMPELPWNNSCGNPQVLAAYREQGASDTTSEDLCNDPSFAPYVENTSGGGGGASSCTVSSDGDLTTCSGGYNKPAWQSSVSGVPADSVRDLPDVSLFAGSGLWGSFYVFCESDVTSDSTCNFDSGDDVQFLAAGGTSFASPAFAGIMSLINQKTNSYQGNANYDLYKLAAGEYTGHGSSGCNSSSSSSETSCIFHDISHGSNAVPCISGSIDCTPTNPSDSLGVLPGWRATYGYDQATGLGSVNAYNLVNAWSAAAASFTTTQTTLTLDESTVSYGSPITGNIIVAAPGDESGSPSGDTSLVTTSGGSFGIGPFGLEKGSAQILGNGVAPGTYSVSARYSGDATFAPSASDPATLTVTKGVTSSSLTASRATVNFLESVTIDATVGTNSTASSPSGTVTFTNVTTGSILGTATVQPASDASGISIARASFNVAGKLLNQGNNNITASYTGDGNYVSSTAAAVTVSYTPPFALSLGQPSIAATSGSSATVAITLAANGNPLPATVTLSCPQPVPAGLSCTFSPAIVAAGSSTTTSTLTLQAVFPSSGSSMGQNAPVRRAQIEKLNAGGIAALASLAVLILPVRRRRIGFFSSIGLLMLLVTMTSCSSGGSAKPPAPPTTGATTTAVSAALPSGPQGTTFTFTANVAVVGSSGSPTGTVTFSDNNSVLGSSSVENGTATFSSNSLTFGSHSVIATYSGDANFLPSSSTKAAMADVQYQTTLSLSASDSLGNVTAIQVPVTVQ